MQAHTNDGLCLCFISLETHSSEWIISLASLDTDTVVHFYRIRKYSVRGTHIEQSCIFSGDTMNKSPSWKSNLEVLCTWRGRLLLVDLLISSHHFIFTGSFIHEHVCSTPNAEKKKTPPDLIRQISSNNQLSQWTVSSSSCYDYCYHQGNLFGNAVWNELLSLTRVSILGTTVTLFSPYANTESFIGLLSCL